MSFSRPDMNIPRKGLSKGQKVLVAVIPLLILLGALFAGLATVYTDLLWFRSVGFSQVWRDVVLSRFGLGLLSVAGFTLIMWINLLIADKRAPTIVSFAPQDELVRQWRRQTANHKGKLRFLVALSLAVLGGVGFSAYWQEWMLFLHGGNFNKTDPQFGKDIGFFVFKLPMLMLIARWLLVALVFAVAVTVLWHFLNGAIRLHLKRDRIGNAVMIHVSVLFALIALVRAAQYWLRRYELSFSDRGPGVVGANYTDVQYLLPGLGLLAIVSIIAAVAFLVGARTKSIKWPATTVVLSTLLSLLVAVLIPAGVQRFVVQPAESEKERPYIQRNVDATRDALDLNTISVRDFNYTKDLTAQQLKDNSATIRNVRLWDTDLVNPSFRRLQESRSYFQFNDIDIDRYQMNNQLTQMMVSVRDINPNKLPQGRTSWVNQHLAFTHGYGAVAAPANAVTSNGEPDFSLKDLPPTGSPEIKVPQVYFGEETPSYSIVNTKQGEVDFTAADGRDQVSKYQGNGGVKLDNVFKRAAFASRVGAIEPLISDLVTSDSRAMYLTNIRERVIKAAPFLKFDNDPYAVVVDGRIKWVQDAYTTSRWYPYGETADTSLVANNSASLSSENFNYVRNSVKVVTDAYDGNMTFYTIDHSDPVVSAWEKSFPKLFTRDEMPAELKAHVRYPEDLFRTQTTMFGSYHLTDANGFYSKSDRWNIAQRPGTNFGGNDANTTVVQSQPNVSGAGAERRIEPSYLLMKLPGEDKERFLMIQPFVPYSPDDSRKELSAFMVAKSDADQYGDMEAFVMPRGQQIDGPALVEARIQADPNISQYITLLSRAGSTVALGDMLIIPVNNSLMYVRPLYVQAQQTKVPEFKKAIVVQGDKIAMEDTLQGALSKMFGSAPETLEQKSAEPGAGGGTTPPAGEGGTPPAAGGAGGTGGAQLSGDAQALLDRANTEFQAADQALRNGNLAEYQAKVQSGIDLVRQARGG